MPSFKWTIEEYDKDTIARLIYEHEHATRPGTSPPKTTAHLRGPSFRLAPGQPAFVSLTLARDSGATEVFAALDSSMAGLACATDGVSSRDSDHPPFVKAFISNTNDYGIGICFSRRYL